jgi:hypothetical protein
MGSTADQTSSGANGDDTAQSGSVVTVDLFGDDRQAPYAAAFASNGTTISSSYICAVHWFRLTVDELEQVIQENPQEPEPWLDVVCHLLGVVSVFEDDEIGGHNLTVDSLTFMLLSDLFEGCENHTPLLRRFRSALDRCEDKLSRVRAELAEHAEEGSKPVFKPLDGDIGQINNRAEFLRALAEIKNKGVDLDTLEVGFCFDGTAVRSIRGMLKSESPLEIE